MIFTRPHDIILTVSLILTVHCYLAENKYYNVDANHQDKLTKHQFVIIKI